MGVGVEVFPVVTIVADKVGDCAKDLICYGGVWWGHGVVRRRREASSFFMGGSVGMVKVRGGGVKVFWRWLLLGVKKRCSV